MTSKKKAPPVRKKAGLTMHELSRASGVSPDQIHDYIAQGLLPAPTMALDDPGDTECYDAACIELVKLIHTFHTKYSLPLSMIKQVIEEVGHDKAALIASELEEKLTRARQVAWFTSISEAAGDETVLSREEFLEAAGISEQELDEAVRQNFITPDKNGRFDRGDLDIATILSELKGNKEKNSDILASLLSMRLKMTEALVEEEFNEFLKNILNNNISVEDANDLGMKSFDLLTDLFPKCYWQLLNKRIKHLLSS